MREVKATGTVRAKMISEGCFAKWSADYALGHFLRGMAQFVSRYQVSYITLVFIARLFADQGSRTMLLLPLDRPVRVSRPTQSSIQGRRRTSWQYCVTVQMSE